jgi:hypothetical protein
MDVVFIAVSPDAGLGYMPGPTKRPLDHRVCFKPSHGGLHPISKIDEKKDDDAPIDDSKEYLRHGTHVAVYVSGR